MPAGRMLEYWADGNRTAITSATRMTRRAEEAVSPASDPVVGGTVTEELVGLSVGQRRPFPPRTGRRSGLRLLASYLVTVFLLITVNFLLPRALPGDPISELVDPGAPAFVSDDALRAELEAYYGLDRPLPVQYVGYLGDLVGGDLGVSIRYNAPVAELVRERLPWTALLIASGIAMAAAMGWTGGVHSGWRRGRRVDRGLLSLFLGFNSFPSFFIGSLAVFVFSVNLGWFPLAGTRTPFDTSLTLFGRLLDVAYHLVLPALTLAVSFATSQYLVMRASMVGELGSDYLLLGRAKGLRDRRLKYRHAARNALLPVVTLTAIHVGFAVTTAVVVETVFAYQGMGRLLFESVSFRDYPTLQACFLVLTLGVVTLNFLADVLVARLDPRARA